LGEFELVFENLEFELVEVVLTEKLSVARRATLHPRRHVAPPHFYVCSLQPQGQQG
jgi:hypothetical protein